MSIQEQINELTRQLELLERAAGFVGQQQRQPTRPGGNSQAQAAAQERRARLAALRGDKKDPAYLAELAAIREAGDMLAASSNDLSPYGQRELASHIERRLRNLEGRPALPRTFSRAAGGRVKVGR